MTTADMTTDREVEVTHEVSTFVAELRRLADALESGAAFTVDMDGENIEVPEGAQLSIVHEREDGQVELEFQLSWTEAEADDEEDDEDLEADSETAEEPAV